MNDKSNDKDAESDSTESAPSGERAWVKSIERQIAGTLSKVSTHNCCAKVCCGYRLPYTSEILRYGHDSDDPLPPKSQRYETDLLIYDEYTDGSGWIRRVVIECKLGRVTTHDALTYSTKAATHKHVHPYLRYGILIGAYGSALPPRRVRHGAYFDFMMVWADAKPSKEELSILRGVLPEEVHAGRLLQQLLTELVGCKLASAGSVGPRVRLGGTWPGGATESPRSVHHAVSFDCSAFNLTPAASDAGQRQ